MTAANVSHLPEPAPKKKKAASVAAREAEAEDGYVTVEQCGITLRIPMAGKIPFKAYMAFMKGEEIEGTEILLGPKQWAEFLEKDPTLEDFQTIGSKILEQSGN